MTLSHSSKDPLCPLTQRDKVGGGGAFWFQVSPCGYDVNGKRKTENGKLIAHRSPFTVHSFFYIPPPHFVVLPLSQGEKVDGVQITDNRGQH